MHSSFPSRRTIAIVLIALFFGINSANAQSVGNSTSVSGTVVDPSGALVVNAVVHLHNAVSGFERNATTDASGKFTFPNVPFNPYHIVVTGAGFTNLAKDIEVRSAVPMNLNVTLQIAGSTTAVTVEGEAGDLLENDSSFHTDVDRGLFDKIPLESASSSVSSLVTLSSPGITADSNGLFHGLGDHAENSFSVDGQPITDQQSKIFSNQIPLDSVESMEVISGAPPAEYGEKTSVVINVTTRSGQGLTTPKGSVTASYGSFGSSNVGFNLGYGGEKWGNFISASGLESGRFLDPPEFAVMHDRGNEENVFDRIDYQLSTKDSVHLNLGYTRSWFQNPNAYDNLNVTGPDGSPVGEADQRSQINTFNIAPSWTRLLSAKAVFTLGGFVRRDQYNYYPSDNPFADLGPIQQETIGQNRTLANAGVRSDLSYVKGIHNVKIGATYQRTFLTENDRLGIIDPTLLASLTDVNGNSCLNQGGQPFEAPCTTLAPFDLTRGGGLYDFRGHTDIKQLALYAQDMITRGNWSLNLGLRSDFYNGLATHKEVEPRLGVSYNVKKTNTVFRLSYARALETPFNENLVLSSTGCNFEVIAALVPCVPAAFSPGWRNEFHAGLQQAFGRHLVFSGEYIWKYTHNGYDFSILGNTPIFFPIAWNNSKIPGFAGRISVPDFHGLTALVVFSSVAARFFPPQIGGLGVTVGQGGTPFRIDHDEKFNQTAHLQYQPWKQGPWVGFNWRFDSGLVAGSVPFATSADPGDPGYNVDLSGLTADQEFEAGLICDGRRATPASALPASCPGSQFASSLVTIPAPGTENDDHNPPRIAPRSLFDLAIGHDNLFHRDKYKISAQLAVINLTNKYALYNFLSTFSGTHYVTPRAITAQLGFHF
jgi:hypothetical protein